MRAYLWVILLALLWPLLHLTVFIYRFGRLPEGVGLTDSLVFIPMGIVSGIVLIFLMQKAKSRGRKISTFVGYLLATPIAFVGSLLSGLIFDPLVGTLIYGALPLIAGTALGFGIGRRWDA